MNIKQILTAMPFMYLSYSTFAQSQTWRENLSENNKWQIGANINSVEPIQTQGGFDFNQRFTQVSHRKDKSYNIGLNLSYKVEDNFSIRLSAKLTEYSIEETQDTREITYIPVPPSNNYSLNYVKANSSVICISPGIIYDFKYKIINLYCGFQLTYKYYNRVVGIVRDEVYEVATNNFLSSDNQAVKQGGGFAIGAGPFIGFNIKAYKSLSVGAEFSSAFLYYKLGSSDYEDIVTTIPYAPSTPSYTIASHKSDTYEGTNFSNVITSINILINF